MSDARQELSGGGVVVRRGPEGTRVLVLHHRGFDEWRLPKGKFEEGESAAQVAEREVREEAGLDLPAGDYLDVTHYRYADPKGPGDIVKLVFFFAMSVDEGAEVILEERNFDEFAWLSPRDAAERLTWPAEAEMVARAVTPR